MESYHFRNKPRIEETPVSTVLAEETLVSDARAGLTPAQMVERRLHSLLQTTPPPAVRPAATALPRTQL
jgi:hypothetical protein